MRWLVHLLARCLTVGPWPSRPAALTFDLPFPTLAPLGAEHGAAPQALLVATVRIQGVDHLLEAIAVRPEGPARQRADTAALTRRLAVHVDAVAARTPLVTVPFQGRAYAVFLTPCLVPPPRRPRPATLARLRAILLAQARR